MSVRHTGRMGSLLLNHWNLKNRKSRQHTQKQNLLFKIKLNKPKQRLLFLNSLGKNEKLTDKKLSTPKVVQQIQIEPLRVQPEPISQTGMTTESLIRPDDQLRQSIEAFLLDQRSPHTQRAYGKDLKRFVKFLLERKWNQGVERIDRSLIVSYKDSLLVEKLQHTSIDRHLATLRSFFKWLVDDGILEKSPADSVRFLNPKRLSVTNGFTDEEVAKILVLPDLHTRSGALHYAILMVLFYCGVRRSELCDLRTRSVGKERGHHVLRLKGKGNAERIIVMIPPVWNALKYYFRITQRDFSQDAPLFMPLKNNRTGVYNKAMDPSAIFYIVTRYAALAGISKRVSPHSCRATAISNARDHNVPDRAIQEFAGWASPDMITRYDKRKNSVENSAARSISYGIESRDHLPSLGGVASSAGTASGDGGTRSEEGDIGSMTGGLIPLAAPDAEV